MIHLVDKTNRHLYEVLIEKMHRQRHDEFVVSLGWRALKSEGGLEFDDYDDENAMYLLALTPDGEIAVSTRIRMADPSGLISDHFSHLVMDGVDQGYGIYECTRYLVAPGFRGAGGFEFRSKLHVAILELVEELGAKRLLGFTDVQLVMHMRRASGLKIQPVGMPADYQEGTALAFEFLLGPEPMEYCREKLQLKSRQLFQAPHWLIEHNDAIALEKATSIIFSDDKDLKIEFSTKVEKIAERLRHQPESANVLARLLAQAN